MEENSNVPSPLYVEGIMNTFGILNSFLFLGEITPEKHNSFLSEDNTYEKEMHLKNIVTT